MTNAIALPQNAIFQNDSQIKTTSLKVAEAFNKLHKDVLRKLENLECSPEFASAHFCAHEEMIQAGAVKRLSKVYEMTKDGFMFLVMGFTGKKAAQIKEAYINEFNRMADLLNGKTSQKASTVDDRAVLNLAVKTLADLRAQSGKPADTASVWRMVDGHLGIQSIEHASLAEVNEALVFVHQQLHSLVYEGEWLPRPATPAASPVKINYPVQRWFDENPWFKKHQEMNRPGQINITADMLYGMDAKSPTLMLVLQLTKEGHNLEACKLEVLALRHHLENARNALKDIQRHSGNSLTGLQRITLHA